MNRFSRFIVCLTTAISLAVPTVSLAQQNTGGALFQSPKVTVNGQPIPKPSIGLPNLSQLFGENTTLQNVLDFVVRTLLLIGGIAAFFFAFYGGIKYITSGPNSTGAEEGKRMITGSIIGIVIIALAYVVVLYIINVLNGAIG
jgi:hypothetical protein